MATTAIPSAGGQSHSTSRTVDASLWWDPFSSLLTELECSALSSQSLANKLRDNHAWFLGSISKFKQPNHKSREALDSLSVKIGSHELNIHPKLKDIACKISAIMCLDEVQSYIVVTRSAESNNLVSSDIDYDILNSVILEYYTERQCLLKCIRQIFMDALYSGFQSGESAIMEEAQVLISDELESKLVSNLLDLVSSNCIEHMDVDLYTLWAEEMLIEDNLILDILFLVYNESFRVCDVKSWKKLCSLYEVNNIALLTLGFLLFIYGALVLADIVTGLGNFQKLAISPEATSAIYHAKVQLLLILIEALNLDSLLQMIHDSIPFRQGQIAFSETDITEMDTIISSLNASEVKEMGPLILAWAVFICLISSLPKKEETNMLLEINHIAYVRQAFEASSLGYFLEILQSGTLKDPEGPLAGYRSVMRTFISAFIASYEISLQFEDDNFKSILEILCNIYRGEEWLSIQFWDRDSFIDGPIRCLLCNLEGEFPYRTVELVRLLSALCEGAWPSECVFNFLNKSVGLSTPMEIGNGSEVDAVSKVVETHFPLHVTGVEGLVIPSKSRGQVLRMIDKDVALVRWEYTESGVLVLLLRLAQELHTKNFDEVHAILGLLSRLAMFNMAVCYALMDAGKSFLNDVNMLRNQEKYIRIDVVEIICFLVKSLSPSVNNAVRMALGINILTKMLECLPSRVATMVLKVNIFDVDVVSNSSSSRSWLLSGRLAKILLIDFLDFTVKLLDTGLENDTVLALIVFCIQYVFVNHESWAFKVKHSRWNVTVKVLEVMKKCIQTFSCYKKLGDIVRDVLLGDSSVHTVLFRIVCRTSESLEKLYLSRFVGIVDIEGLKLSVSAGLDVLISLVSAFAKDPPSFPVFHHAILSSVTKPMLVTNAAMSLISYFGDPKIQIGAARLLSVLFTSDSSQSFAASLGLDNKQLSSFRKSMVEILCEQWSLDEDLIVAALKLLASAVLNQPAFLTAVIVPEDISNDKEYNADSEHQKNKTENGSSGPTNGSLLDSILHHVRNSEDLLKRKPNILLSLMKFLRVLWQDAPQYSKILEHLKLSDNFWRLLTSSVMLITSNQDKVSEKLTEEELQCQSFRYQYLSNVLDIIGHEIFLQKRLMHGELVVNGFPISEANGTKRKEDSEITKNKSFVSLKEIISTWCESSLLSDLIKACVCSEYDNKIHWQAKVAAALCVVHVMIKLKNGDSGSLSLSFIERIATLAQKLRKLPAFSYLTTLYAERGYSEEQELDYLILSDLFYHIKGETEGRHIDNRLFKELLQFLLESEFLDKYRYRKDDDILSDNHGIYLYDSVRLRADLGLEMWDLLAWTETKEVAETALFCWQRVNLMIVHSHAKLSALRGIISLFYMHGENFSKVENITQLRLSEQLVLSCINHICQCLHATLESLIDVPDTDEDGLNILTAQAELLMLLTRSMSNDFARSAFVVIVKTSGYGLKVLCSFRQSVGVITAKKVFLMLILSSVELSFKDLHSGPVEVSPEASNASLGLLPVLCDCIEHMDSCTLSLTAIDLILGSFSIPATWFPIIQKHFPLQHVVQKLRLTSSKTVSVILKFLLNFARVREGAEMLLNSGVLASIRMLLSNCSGSVPFPVVQFETSISDIAEKTEMPQMIWGLSLAVLASIIQSLENSSSSASVVEYVLSSILVDKAPLILLYLSAPDFPFEGHEKKRSRALKSTISLHELEETENTMTLICVLARHWNSWNKALKNIESQLREKMIHFLAFLSRATQRPGESPRKDSPLLCHPVLKEELEWYNEPSFINSRNGWFALSALGCQLSHKFSALSSRTALVVRDQSSGKANIAPQTHFSDLIAIEIYKIAFLILKFQCIQAESASKMAEEVGFVDLAHFPELPMPDILHGLQDQGISIVTELCTASKARPLTREIQDTCNLMLQITVMALHLEYCVIQICGIRPVLGHVETFSKELQLLLRATEGHLFLKESLKDLKQIVSYVYPDFEASY
ncbi:hypothetical protein F511_09314 [Dorcoceras hygrometricum]|uniref:Uncharacterized protein n=1 Tax=Dorcoceras hygrometricum TaxID=472368 RepID=A0A2Z7C9V4_9LAMI|nr:hypothetical protein F511_09314 [Dorcoceras hygrometricum]